MDLGAGHDDDQSESAPAMHRYPGIWCSRKDLRLAAAMSIAYLNIGGRSLGTCADDL